MQIYIVRHGETNANQEGYLQGWSNDPLNENGRKLAEITGQGMRDINFNCCISSPLIRAQETAEIILQESGNDIHIQFDDRIKEINFGTFERISIRDEKVIRFLQNPIIDYKFSDGESIVEVMGRTQNFLKELIARDDDKTYLISTHGCASRALLNRFYEEPENFWQEGVPPNCAVSIVEAAGGQARLTQKDHVYCKANTDDMWARQKL